MLINYKAKYEKDNNYVHNYFFVYSNKNDNFDFWTKIIMNSKINNLLLIMRLHVYDLEVGIYGYILCIISWLLNHLNGFIKLKFSKSYENIFQCFIK